MTNRSHASWLAFALLGAALLGGCPSREEAIDRIGGAPGRTMEKMRDAVQDAEDRAAERERQLDRE